MSQRILDVYRSILSFAGMVVENDGSIYAQLTKTQEKKKVMIGDEPLVFPIEKQFNDPNQNKVYFHPLSENFLRGESEVVQKLRSCISIRLNFVTVVVIQYLLELLGSSEFHRRLNEEQSDLLKFISEGDSKSSIHWSELMRKVIQNSAETGYVKLYLKRAGTWKGETYSRIGVVSFPFYQDLVDGKYDAQTRVKDRPSYKKILEFIFPNLDKPEAYNYGTRTQVAPFLDALMSTSAGIAERLNSIIAIYKDYIADADDLLFNMDWYQSLRNLDDLRDEIRKMPELKGNAGVTTVSERNHPPQELNRNHVPSPTPLGTAPAPPAPYQIPQVQPVQNTIQNQFVAQAPPQQVAASSAQVPQVRQNEKGAINFNDVLRANPGMAMQHNPFAQQAVLPPQVQAYVAQYGVLPPGYQAPGMMQRTAPSWAAPVAPMYQQPYTGQPMMMTPQMQPPMAPQLPPPPPGTQYVWNPAMNQFVLVQMQPQPMAQPMQQGPAPPPGWGWR